MTVWRNQALSYEGCHRSKSRYRVRELLIPRRVHSDAAHASVVPMTGQDTVLDAAALEREAHVWATIVQREDVSAIWAIVDDEDRTMASVHNELPLRGQFLKATASATGESRTGDRITPVVNREHPRTTVRVPQRNQTGSTDCRLSTGRSSTGTACCPYCRVSTETLRVGQQRRPTVLPARSGGDRRHHSDSQVHQAGV